MYNMDSPFSLNDCFEDKIDKDQLYLNQNNSLCECLDFFITHENLINIPLPKSEKINNLIKNEKTSNNKEYLEEIPTLKEQIPLIDTNKKNDIPISNYENITLDIKKSTTLGRKARNSDSKVYDKYSIDNIIRKIKNTLKSYLRNFINDVIYRVYKGKIGHGPLKMELKSPESKTKNVKENQELLYKKLKDLFSIDISGKYSNYFNYHNKKIISNLLNEKNEEIRKIFENIFNLTFLECLNHFTGKYYIKELEGLKTLNEVFKIYENEPEYLKMVHFYAYNYEGILFRKKPRNGRKKQK